jgi:hypothetical protein
LSLKPNNSLLENVGSLVVVDVLGDVEDDVGSLVVVDVLGDVEDDVGSLVGSC